MNWDNDFYRAVLDRGDAAVLVIDQEDLAIRWASRAARRLFGGARGPLPDLVASDDAATVGTFLQGVAAHHSGASRCTCSVPVRGSVPRRIDLIARNLSADPAVRGLVVVALDVTGWAERSNRLIRQLNTDAKTGLANWASYLPRLEQAIRGAPESGPGPVLMFLDLDDFKKINDRFGHAAGDEVIRRTAATIATVVGERGTAARIGGDEFAILLDHASEEEAVELAEEVGTAIRSPTTLGRGVTIRVTASVGIALARPGIQPDVLSRQADTAMYRAKAGGHDQIAVYRAELADWMLDRKNLVDQLAERLEQLHEENQALTEAATIDHRTGLPNSAVFETDHTNQNSSGEPYSLLLIDLDHFHSYNEIYGYLAGHEALRKVGEAISRTVRKGDRTYRYGGEEITVLLPRASIRDAMVISERVRQTVQRLGIEHRGNEAGVVTVCVGAVEAGRAATARDVVERASRAVFEAKAAGRNRVVGRRAGSV